MGRRVRALGLALALMLVLPLVVNAANPHFLSGPTFSLTRSGALEATGTIAGVGNQDIVVSISATGTSTCTNQGGNVPPGQTQTVTGSTGALAPKNGKVTFDVVTAPLTPASCPDHQRPQASFTSATLTVSQAGQVIFQQTYTF